MYSADRKLRHLARAVFAAAISVIALPGVIASAQQSQTPTVTAFLANPQELLQKNPNGGSRLSNELQQLALLNPSMFKVLLGLLEGSNDLQRGAIGEGLAQAAKIEVLTDQAIAADWQQQIDAIDDPTFKAAVTNAFGDVKLGAIGGGPLGGDGGGPAGPFGSPGPLQNFPSNAVSTQSFAITSSTTSASGSFASTGRSPSTPVSP